MASVQLVYDGENSFLKTGSAILEGVKSLEVDQTIPPLVKVVGLLKAEEYVTDEPAQFVLVHTEDGKLLVKHGAELLDGVKSVKKVGNKLEIEFAVSSVDFSKMKSAEKVAPKKPEDK